MDVCVCVCAWGGVVVMTYEEREGVEIVVSTEKQFISVFNIIPEYLWYDLLLFSVGKSQSSKHQGFFVCNLWAVFEDIPTHRGILGNAGSASPGCCAPSMDVHFPKFLLPNFKVPWPARCTEAGVQTQPCTGHWPRARACRTSPWDWEGIGRPERILEREVKEDCSLISLIVTFYLEDSLLENLDFWWIQWK